jgi:predicted nucleic acid-binding protein
MLLYAEIDAFPHHKAARTWLEHLLNGDRQVGIAAVAFSVSSASARIGASSQVRRTSLGESADTLTPRAFDRITAARLIRSRNVVRISDSGACSSGG